MSAASSPHHLALPLTAPSSEPPSAPASRDAAIDALRGVAILLMIASHVGPNTKFGALLHLPMWISAAEVFVLLSGTVVGMRASQRSSPAERSELGAGLFRRARTLLLFHYALCFAVIAVHSATGRLDSPSFDELGGVLATLAGVLTLRVQPLDLMNILPLYVVFLAASPFVLEQFARGRTAWVLASSGGLWLAAQAWPGILPLPDPNATSLVFSLAAWQFTYFAGAALGFHKRSLEAWFEKHRVNALAITAVSVAAVFILAQLHRRVFGMVLNLPSLTPWLFDKRTWGPVRALYSLGLLFLAYAALRRYGRALTSRGLGSALGSLQAIGRHSFGLFLLHLLPALLVSYVQLKGAPQLLQELTLLATFAAFFALAQRPLWLKALPN